MTLYSDKDLRGLFKRWADRVRFNLKRELGYPDQAHHAEWPTFGILINQSGANHRKVFVDSEVEAVEKAVINTPEPYQTAFRLKYLFPNITDKDRASDRRMRRALIACGTIGENKDRISVQWYQALAGRAEQRVAGKVEQILNKKESA